MFHLGGFAETQDAGGSAAFIAALVDDRLFTNGDRLRVPPALTQVPLVAAGIASGATIGARLRSPSLDEFTNMRIRPYNGGADEVPEPDSPPAYLDLRANPMQLVADEQLRAETDSDPTAGELEWVLLWFADGPLAPVGGQRMFTVRGIDTSALTVDIWSDAQLTLDEELPAGRYQILGARFQSTGCIAGRIINREGQQWRPGALGCDDDQDLDGPGQRFGGWGVWAEFPFEQLPNVEILTESADQDLEVFLDLVRIGG